MANYLQDVNTYIYSKMYRIYVWKFWQHITHMVSTFFCICNCEQLEDDLIWTKIGSCDWGVEDKELCLTVIYWFSIFYILSECHIFENFEPLKLRWCNFLQKCFSSFCLLTQDKLNVDWKFREHRFINCIITVNCIQKHPLKTCHFSKYDSPDFV